jgi:hypothetical protein
MRPISSGPVERSIATAEQGFSGPRDREQILGQFAVLPLSVPDRRDHVDAAELRNKCRRDRV